MARSVSLCQPASEKESARLRNGPPVVPWRVIRMSLPIVRRGWLLISFALVGGCAFFNGHPPLPKHASIEREPAPSEATDFAALVAEADVIYFPSGRAASGGRSEPAARLLDAMRQAGVPFAIGWDLIEAGQQPLLDELRTKSGAARDELIARLDLAGTGRSREHCRSVLRDSRIATVPQLALRCPESIRAKLEGTDRLTADEQKQLAEGYSPPAGGLEEYAERLSSNRGMSERALAGSYRAQLATQQFIADKIVGYCRSAGTTGKLLVFLRESDLEAGGGVPRYVLQKLKVRQLVLDSSSATPTRPRLLTA